MRKRFTITLTTALVTLVVVVFALNFVTPEKHIERMPSHRYSTADSQFVREMSVLLGPAVVAGNQVSALHNGVEAFPAMLSAIRGAQVSITFETYIYWSGEIGRAFGDALSERARAGIPVKVIIDWLGSVQMDEQLLNDMEAAGVAVHRYRPLRWYNWGRVNNRTHRRLLVVDGKVGFTGGIGIADFWQGDAGDPEHWRDTHYRIEGPAVAQMQAAFNDNWIKTTGEVLNGPAYFPPLEQVGETDAHVFIASPAGGSESMHLMYLMAIAAAERSIDIAASYFVPDELMIQSLLAARDRQVRVRLLLPGEHTDSDAVRLRSKASWGRLLEVGIEIYEYQPTMMHSKLFVVDAEFVSVGSTNLDPRSFRLNDEVSLNIYESGFARQMTDVYEEDLIPTIAYTYEMWAERPLREKVAEWLLLPIESQL